MVALTNDDKIRIIHTWVARFDWATKGEYHELIGWFQPSGKSAYTQYVVSEHGMDGIINNIYERTKATVWNMVGLCGLDK
jgi:hypothetical protein